MKKHFIRRVATFVMASLTISTAVLADRAWAQNSYPSKPINIIISYGPGSSTDTIARLMQPELEKELGVPVVIVNKGGAGGAIGTNAIASADPDGYTIGMSVVSTFSTNLIFKKQTYDPLTDFSFISRLGYMPRGLAVNSEFPATTHADLVKELTQNPNKYFYSTVINTADQLNAEIYKSATGTKITAVTYSDNAGKAQLDLAANRVQLAFESLPVIRKQLPSGIRLMALSGDTRHPLHPDVPTFKELGLEDLNISSYYGFVGPKDMSKDHVAKLNAALKVVLANQKVADGIANFGVLVKTSTPEQHRQDVIKATRIYTSTAAKLGITPN